MKLISCLLFGWILFAASSVMGAELTLLTPNGGETLAEGMIYPIEWEPADSPETVAIGFSSDNGGSWTPVGTVANTGVYEWTVPSLSSELCLIRICDGSDPLICDMSDAVFIIYPCQAEIIGDLDHDCYVDLLDVSLVAANWLLCANPYDITCPCMGDYRDCDGDPNNGCEVNITNDPANCGQCGYVCNLPNAVSGCANGDCIVSSCLGNYRNCDGNPANGCETNILNNMSHCGACNIACSAPHANMACSNGTCVITSCQSGFYDCDGIAANGCEGIQSDSYETNNTCITARNIGTIQEESAEQNWMAQILPTGDEDWFRFYAQEGDHTCLPWEDQDYTVRIRLIPPSSPCQDYDLYLYDDNCNQLAASTQTGCTQETITYTWDGQCGADDSRSFRVRVIGWNGAWACTNYTLFIDMWQE